jgi:hypothetical protein
MIWKDFGLKRSWNSGRSILAFVWRDTEKPQKLSVRIASAADKIRSEEFLNKKDERYPFANSFGEGLLV